MIQASHNNGAGGVFATSRRGGLTNEEVRTAQALRSGARPWSFQNIARRLGRSEIDVRRMLDAGFAEDYGQPSVVEQPGRTNFPWTDKQTAYLIANYKRQGPGPVALALGCSRTAAIGKAHRLGIIARPAKSGEAA